MKKLVVHVLSYRAIDHLRAGSLKEMIAETKRINDFETHLVFQDNYSQDGSIEYALNMKNIDILLSPSNLLYAKGVNSGLQYVEYTYKPDYVIIADADNYCSVGCYRALLDFMEANPRVGLAQPLVVSKINPHEIYSCGHQYIDDIFCRPIRQMPENQDELLNLPSCSLCSAIARVDVLRKTGLLNEAFKIYYESSDLSFRIRDSGYYCACCKKALAFNEKTVGRKTGNYHEAFYRWRNGLLFWYLHNNHNYLRMKDAMLKELEPLEHRFSQSTYCTDCIEESTRKGILSGIDICQKYTPAELRNFSPGISEFDKSSVIVLQQGGDV